MIYEDNNYKYLVSCSQIDYLYLIDNEDNKLLLKDAIKNNIITVSDLSNTILTVHKEKIMKLLVRILIVHYIQKITN